MDDQVRALSVLALFLRFREHHGEAAARVTKLRSSSVSTTMRLTPQLFMRTFLIFKEDLAKKKACDERCSLPCLTTAIKHANNSSSGISRVPSCFVKPTHRESRTASLELHTIRFHLDQLNVTRSTCITGERLLSILPLHRPSSCPSCRTQLTRSFTQQ
jgi:hypothetical protein